MKTLRDLCSNDAIDRLNRSNLPPSESSRLLNIPCYHTDDKSDELLYHGLIERCFEIGHKLAFTPGSLSENTQDNELLERLTVLHRAYDNSRVYLFEDGDTEE
jgi:hypothetical protein